MEAEGRLFGGVWGGGAPPQRKMDPGAIANSEIRNPATITAEIATMFKFWDQIRCPGSFTETFQTRVQLSNWP